MGHCVNTLRKGRGVVFVSKLNQQVCKGQKVNHQIRLVPETVTICWSFEPDRSIKLVAIELDNTHPLIVNIHWSFLSLIRRDSFVLLNNFKEIGRASCRERV